MRIKRLLEYQTALMVTIVCLACAGGSATNVPAGKEELPIKGYQQALTQEKSVVPWQTIKLLRPDSATKLTLKTRFGPYTLYDDQNYSAFIAKGGQYFAALNQNCVTTPLQALKGSFFIVCGDVVGNLGFVLNFEQRQIYADYFDTAVQFGESIYLIDQPSRVQSTLGFFEYPSIRILALKSNNLNIFHFGAPGIQYKSIVETCEAASLLVRGTSLKLNPLFSTPSRIVLSPRGMKSAQCPFGFIFDTKTGKGRYFTW